MSKFNEEIRNVVRDLILEGLEVSITSVQTVLLGKGVVAFDEQIVPVLEEEGGPLPAYYGFEQV